MSLRAESLQRAASDAGLLESASFRNCPRSLKGIDAEIQRCKDIVGSLVAFTRQSTGTPSPTDLNALVRGAVDLVEHQTRPRGVEIRLRLDPRLPSSPADQSPMGQAFLAILINAAETARPGGRIEVETRSTQGGCILHVVSDDIVDAPADSPSDTFMPFFAARSLRRAPEMGLAACRRIVSGHGGTISVESARGRTRMTVELPQTIGDAPEARGEPGG